MTWKVRWSPMKIVSHNWCFNYINEWQMLERRENFSQKVTSGNGIYVPQLVCVYVRRFLDGAVLCELGILSSDIFIAKKLIVWHSKCMHLWTLMVFNAIQCRIFVIPAINEFIVSSILSENKYCIINGYNFLRVPLEDTSARKKKKDNDDKVIPWSLDDSSIP